MTVTEIVERFLIHAAAIGLYCPEASSQRKDRLGRFVEAFGHMQIEDCQPYHLSDWIEANPKWASSSTRKGVANQVNAAFNWAVRQRRIRENPFAFVNYPEAEPRPAMPDDCLETIENLGNKPFERACQFLRLTGCRLSDMCQLLWKDVDLERGTALLQKHKTRKKTGKPKEIALVPEAIALLGKLPRSKSGHVFVNSRGTPWTRQTMGQNLLRLKARHGIETPASLHGIRHQFGTVSVKNGSSLKMVSLQMGHASVAVTERFYVHTEGYLEQMRDAAKAAQRRP